MLEDVVPTLVDQVKQLEGFRSVPYHDATGRITVGYGETHDSKWADLHRPGPITEEQATLMLRASLYEAQEKVREAFGTLNLKRTQIMALVDFMFNVGQGRKAGTFSQDDAGRDGLVYLANGEHSTLYNLIHAGEYVKAGYEFPKWSKGRIDGHEQVLPGLYARRMKEMAWWNEV